MFAERVKKIRGKQTIRIERMIFPHPDTCLSLTAALELHARALRLRRIALRVVSARLFSCDIAHVWRITSVLRTVLHCAQHERDVA